MATLKVKSKQLEHIVQGFVSLAAERAPVLAGRVCGFVPLRMQVFPVAASACSPVPYDSGAGVSYPETGPHWENVDSFSSAAHFL